MALASSGVPRCSARSLTGMNVAMLRPTTKAPCRRKFLRPISNSVSLGLGVGRPTAPRFSDLGLEMEETGWQDRRGGAALIRHAAAGFGQLADEPFRLQRVGKPRFGPAL